MRSFVRSILAVIAGLVVAVIIITVFEMVNSQVYPLPPGVDPTDQEALRAVAKDIPAGAFVLVVAGWAAGALAGAWSAGRLVGRSSLVHGMVVAVLLFIFGVINMLLIPHPVWLAGIVGFLGCGYVGARLAARPAPTA